MTELVINVQPGVWGNTCRMFGKRFRKCKRKPNFMIFGDDGKPKSSRLEGCVCDRHLASAVLEVKKIQDKAMLAKKVQDD